MRKLPFNLPRFSLRLRLSISITAIVALFTLTNITYQISSQNRNLRLDNLQKAVQGQLASVTTRQTLQNQQKEILVLDALKQSGEETLSKNEINSGLANLRDLSNKIRQLGSYAYQDSLQAYRQLATNHAELDMLWQEFYSLYNSDQTPLASSIEQSFDETILLLGEFESLEIQSAEKLTAQLQKVSKFNDRVTLGIYLFTIVLTVGLGYLLIRYTTQSLKNLNVGTVRIGRGDLDYHIPVNSDDELGDLTIAFNQMADKLRNAMAQVQQSKENADQANRAKTNFLANMSHELRTPLNAIIGYSEMTIDVYSEENKLDEQQVVSDLQHILSSGRHLLQLINDVLDLAKIESGNMTVFNETFDSVKIIKGLATTMMPLANKNNNRLVIEASHDIPQIYSDAVKFRQIFINLISNACKFTHEGKITILITAKPDTNQLIYHVTDTGIGMSPASMQHIFDAFVQADTDTARKYGGTGLGLAICKQFIEMMHGTLDLTSAEGAGTTFTVVLPIKAHSERRADVIPTKNQRELGLPTPAAPNPEAGDDENGDAGEPAENSPGNAQPSALQSTWPGQAGHEAEAVSVLLLNCEADQASPHTAMHNQDIVLHVAASGADATKLVAEHHIDFLFARLSLPTPETTANAGQQDFVAGWRAIPQALTFADQTQLPMLVLCGEWSVLEQASAAAMLDFDFDNRSRLTIPVRQLNPVARRGNALLAGFSQTGATGHNEQPRLAEELAKEAWHCEQVSVENLALDLNSENSTARNADLIFINIALEADRALVLLQSLCALTRDCDNQKLAAPRLYLVNPQNPNGRCLDRAAVELRLPAPAGE